MNKGFVVAVVATLALPAVASAQTRVQEGQRRRDQIHLMEGVLSRAVRLGAEQVNRRMQSLDPTMTVITGQARARGFVLDGYGVFFDVEVPAMSASAAWSMMVVQRDMQVTSLLETMRRALASLPDGPKLQEAQQALQLVARQVGPVQPLRSNPGEVSSVPPPNTVIAANAPVAITDPSREYAEAVKGALIDAMLDHSLSMDLGAEEWLTVAARESEGPLASNELFDLTTIIIRVRGSDLATYAADRSKRAEVRQKVEVRIF